MAKTSTNPFTKTVQSPAISLVNASSFTATNPGTAPTNTILFFTAGTEGSILKSIIASTDATAAAQTIALWISTDGGTTKYLLGVINVPLSSGYTGAVVNVDVLGANSMLVGLTVDQAGRNVLPLAAGARLYISCLVTAVAASKTLWVTGVAEDF